MVTLVKGNLFGNGEKVIAHVIFGDCRKTVPNAGFAAALRKEYPEAYEPIDGHLFPSGRAIRATCDDGTIVYHLIAKRMVHEKVYHYPLRYYTTLGRALLNMCNDMEVIDEKIVAMPRIGCGLDGGDWESVKTILTWLDFEDIEIKVYILEEDWREVS